MKYYTKIPFWENKRRRTLLNRFREATVFYFNNSEAHWMADDRIENDKAKQTRTEINRMIHEIHKIVILSNVNPSILYTPPPAIGGYVRNIDLIINIFNLQRFQINPQSLIDYIDRAIGVYENDYNPSILRTINPLYWISVIFDYVVSLPFILIGKLGFNQQKIEASFYGKLFKIIIQLILGTAAFLTILDKTGYLDQFIKLIKKIANN